MVEVLLLNAFFGSSTEIVHVRLLMMVRQPGHYSHSWAVWRAACSWCAIESFEIDFKVVAMPFLVSDSHHHCSIGSRVENINYTLSGFRAVCVSRVHSMQSMESIQVYECMNTSHLVRCAVPATKPLVQNDDCCDKSLPTSFSLSWMPFATAKHCGDSDAIAHIWCWCQCGKSSFRMHRFNYTCCWLLLSPVLNLHLPVPAANSISIYSRNNSKWTEASFVTAIDRTTVGGS